MFAAQRRRARDDDLPVRLRRQRLPIVGGAGEVRPDRAAVAERRIERSIGQIMCDDEVPRALDHLTGGDDPAIALNGDISRRGERSSELRRDLATQAERGIERAVRIGIWGDRINTVAMTPIHSRECRAWMLVVMLVAISFVTDQALPH